MCMSDIEMIQVNSNYTVHSVSMYNRREAGTQRRTGNRELHVGNVRYEWIFSGLIFGTHSFRTRDTLL